MAGPISLQILWSPLQMPRWWVHGIYKGRLLSDSYCRQHRVLKNGEVSWRCLGNNCGASIKTDASLTRVVACNQKHSGEHPVTMRSLLSPLTKTVSATGASLATPPALATTPAHAAPPALATLSTPTTTSALPAPPVCSTPGVDLSQSTTSIYNFKTPEDPSAEISRLKQEIKRLENEFQKLLDHTIESDTRLLEYTDQVFPVNNSRVNQIARASATVDYGVQCEPNPSPPGHPAPATVDSDSKHRLHVNLKEIAFPKQKRKTTKFPKNQQYPQNAHFINICIRGDSHARHIAGLLRSITGPTISVAGVCLPGAGLLDVVGSRQMSIESGTRCEVLMAGTNDLASPGDLHHGQSTLTSFLSPFHTDTIWSRTTPFTMRPRLHFTRHGMHLSMRGKRILAGMIVESLAMLRPVPPEPEKVLLVTAVPPAVVPPPAATSGELAAISQRSPRLQLVSYAEAARASTTPDRDCPKEGSPMSKNCSGQTCVKPT
ncbi:hypothetical protein J6590_062286 [Homalodisca vitripennis]|nr:hypothetical protein J6590_062286 [Homalodisca vitripennis]